MAYKFGQFRRNQVSSYSTALTYDLSSIKEESTLSKEVTFVERVINLSGNNILQSVDSTGLKRRSYYIRFRIYKEYETAQKITIKLINTEKTEDNVQTLQTIDIGKGLEEEYDTFEMIISPNGTYNQVKFELNRMVEDYNMKNSDGTYGRYVIMEIEAFNEIYNVMDFLNPSIENKGALKQIGVQGPPGLLMCIDGEEIRIGRSGIYEINNGITINFIGFVVDPGDNKYFILDYQY